LRCDNVSFKNNDDSKEEVKTVANIESILKIAASVLGTLTSVKQMASDVYIEIVSEDASPELELKVNEMIYRLESALDIDTGLDAKEQAELNRRIDEKLRAAINENDG